MSGSVSAGVIYLSTAYISNASVYEVASYDLIGLEFHHYFVTKYHIHRYTLRTSALAKTSPLVRFVRIGPYPLPLHADVLCG